MAHFIRIHNKAVNLDRIAYVDFLDSGRAMVFLSGLTQEKQHIPVEPAEALVLKEFFQREYVFNTDPAPVAMPGTGLRPVAAVHRS